MVGLEAMVLGRLGRKPSPHPRACVLSYPSPTIRGPGSLGHGHLTRPAVLEHNTRRYGHSPSGSPGPIGAARCGHSRRRELRMYGVLGSSLLSIDSLEQEILGCAKDLWTMLQN